MKFIKYLTLFVFLVAFNACKSNSQNPLEKDDKSTAIIVANPVDSNGEIQKITRTQEEWKALLTDQEFYVLREKGTERPFTGDLLKIKEDGVYTCAACGLPLFASDTKFDSGTGWPSYYQPILDENIKEDTDYLLGHARTEVLCARCEGHLGHVFNDGPEPTGLRYCINSVSLNFEEKK